MCVYIYIYIYITSERRIRRLVKTNISQLVSSVTIFSGIFQNCKFLKKYKTSNIFYFTLVLSVFCGD